MLITCDVGNTQTVIGTWSDNRADTEPLATWRITTVAERTTDELAVYLRGLVQIDSFDDVHGIAVSSVVPAATATWRDLTERYTAGAKRLVVPSGFTEALPLSVDAPHEVGADRIVNCVAAIERFGDQVIVVDFGTATTFDVVSDGAYVGGLIIPGIEISLDALAQRAAALRRIDLVEPPSVIGKTTAQHVQSGVFHGQAAMVEGVCQRIKAEIGEAPVVATGGLAPLVAAQTAEIDRQEPWLTLYGLRILYDRFAK